MFSKRGDNANNLRFNSQDSRAIKKLRKNIKLAESRKRSITEKLKVFESQLSENRITYAEYEFLKNNYLGNKTEEEWGKYYDDYKNKASRLIRDYQPLEEKVADAPKKNTTHIIIPLLLVILSLPIFFFLSNYTGFSTAEIVEFEYNHSWQNAFVRISSNGTQVDIPALELLINDTIFVNLSNVNPELTGDVYVDLIADGELIDSRKITIRTDQGLIEPPFNEINFTEPENATGLNETTEIPQENITTMPINVTGEISIEIIQGQAVAGIPVEWGARISKGASKANLILIRQAYNITLSDGSRELTVNLSSNLENLTVILPDEAGNYFAKYRTPAINISIDSYNGLRKVKLESEMPYANVSAEVFIGNYDAITATTNGVEINLTNGIAFVQFANITNSISFEIDVKALGISKNLSSDAAILTEGKDDLRVQVISDSNANPNLKIDCDKLKLENHSLSLHIENYSCQTTGKISFNGDIIGLSVTFGNLSYSASAGITAINATNCTAISGKMVLDKDSICDNGFKINNDSEIDCKFKEIRGNGIGLFVAGKNAKIKNCRITGFRRGIEINDTKNVTLENIVLDNTQLGISIGNVSEVSISNVMIMNGPGTGLLITNSPGIYVENVTVSGNSRGALIINSRPKHMLIYAYNNAEYGVEYRDGRHVRRMLN